MLHGDISNRSAPVICFDANVLFADVKTTNPIKSFFERIGENKETYSFFNRQVDKQAVDVINRVWYNYDFSIYIATTNPTIVTKLEDTLYDNFVDYTRIFCYSSMEQLRNECQNRFHLYVSNNAEHISSISMKNAIMLNDLSKHIKLARG